MESNVPRVINVIFGVVFTTVFSAGIAFAASAIDLESLDTYSSAFCGLSILMYLLGIFNILIFLVCDPVGADLGCTACASNVVIIWSICMLANAGPSVPTIVYWLAIFNIAICGFVISMAVMACVCMCIGCCFFATIEPTP